MTTIPALPTIELVRGSDWKIDLPAAGTVTIDGTVIDFESTGSIQLQYRAQGGTGTPVRWDTGDGAARYDSTNNAFLVPDSDALLSGTGNANFDYDVHYLDASANPHLIGENGTIKVRDASTGLPA